MNIISLLIIVIFNLFFYLNLKYISNKIGIFDYPDNLRKNHDKAIPPIGGIAIFFSLILFIIINILFGKIEILSDFYYVTNQVNYKSVFSFFCCLILLLVIGILDDKNGVSANLRLLFFGLIFYFSILLDDQLILKSLNFQTLNIVIDLDRVGVFFTICCFLVLINSLNMFDGINIQSGLYLLILFLILAYKKIFFNISIPIIISLIFFLYYNYKNKIFIGNHGIYFLSFILSFLVIKNYNTSNFVTVEEVFLLFYLPILELSRLFITRLYKNKNPFKGDSNHIHHYLNRKIKNLTLTALLTNIISFSPFVFFSIYQSFYILIFTTIFYFLLIIVIRKKI